MQMDQIQEGMEEDEEKSEDSEDASDGYGPSASSCSEDFGATEEGYGSKEKENSE